ncbi:MAG: S8 family serine peptidase [Bacteroidetes bacterium]|nr:S8 family serine peptidase [Bacteroidota bacterium]
MKKVIVFILLAAGLVEASAQIKRQKFFKMAANVEYQRGRVLVKIKNEFKDEVSQLAIRNSGARVRNVAVNSVAHLVKPELDRHGAARMGARAQNPTVDISKYFSLTFDASQNVEDYINQLYATGYFEIVEPEYKYRSTFKPNDPAISQQYYLSLIKAYEAWDITQGDTTIVIAIVDTGGNLAHSDISPNLYKNWKEFPPNGKDDDGNGYIDDYQGWDFMGGDTLNVTDSKFLGDSDPSVTKGGDISHGTWAAGCASASANNGNGIAGVGYKTRLLFTKHSADNQRTDNGSLYNVYLGMLYAANQGNVKIINCSFGGSGQSQIIQDIINYIVLDRNCLIVAAAGNDGNSLPSYPAAYDNVLSVAATGKNDVKASFSNFGTTVDLSAPGVGIYTTGYNNVYNTVDGTSFSAPITAGAAALVWAKNPTYTALQVAEQLRVSADATALYTANSSMSGQLGKGRLDIQRALTLTLPSVRASNPKLVNQSGFAAVPGDKAFLTFDFKNFLKSTSAGIQISISSNSSAVSISKSTISPGIIAGGSTISNKLTPFELTIKAGAAPNTPVVLLVKYSDGNYSDYQYETFYVNPSFIDVNSNKITTTVTGIGRIGYQDTEGSRLQGTGFIFDQNPMLFEMGLIMGTSTSNIYNNVRSTGSKYDKDFLSTTSIKQIVPGQRSYSEIFGAFSNSTTSASQAVVVDYRSLVMKDAPYDKFIILEYKVKNPTANPLDNFYFGIFSDWDITTNGQQDAADWDNGNKLGYVYPAQTAAKPYGGIQVLTGTPVYYAIDNDQTISGNPFGIYDGYTDEEKFTTISTQRQKAGQINSSGNDVSQVVSSGPYNIAAGQTITLAFALHAAPNFSELQTSARYADSLYNYTMQASKPLANPDSICYNTKATLNASNATKIKWYSSFTGGQSFFTGTQYVTGNLKNDTAFYVSNADLFYESVRTPIKVKVRANPKIAASGSTTLCQGDTIKLSVTPADSTLWSNGQKTNSIKTFSTGKYSVKVKDNLLGCTSLSDTVKIVVNPKPKANFSVSGDQKTQIPITFTDQSTSAVTWFWDFGDGQNSTDRNPVHTFSVPSSSIKLTVTAANACADTKTSAVSIITALEELPLNGIKVYPNPFSTQGLQIVIDNDDLSQAQLSLTNSLGQSIFSQDISTLEAHAEITIPSSALNDGLYIVKLSTGNKTVVRKVIKVQ